MSDERQRILAVLAAARSMVENSNGDMGEVCKSIVSGLSAVPAGAPDEKLAPEIWEVLTEHNRGLEGRREKGGVWKVPTGLPWLERMVGGWRRGQLVVVAGATSAGKSVLGMQFARVAAEQKRRVLYLLLEMTLEQAIDRVLAATAQVNYQRLEDGRLDGEGWQRVYDVVGEMQQRRTPLRIDERCPMTLDAIKARCRLAAGVGLDMVVVDYIGLVAQAGMAKKRYEHISEIASGLKSLALELNVPILALSQINREAGTGRPTVENLRESGEVGNNADVALMIHRPNKNGDATSLLVEEIELGIVKQRNGPCGWQKFQLVGAEMTVREVAAAWARS